MNIVSTNQNIEPQFLSYLAGLKAFISLPGVIDSDITVRLREVEDVEMLAIMNSRFYLEINTVLANGRFRFELAKSAEEEYDEVDDVLGPVEGCSTLFDEANENEITSGVETTVLVPVLEEVDTDEIRFKYEDGVLSISMPYCQEYMSAIYGGEEEEEELEEDCEETKVSENKSTIARGKIIKKYEVE